MIFFGFFFREMIGIFYGFFFSCNRLAKFPFFPSSWKIFLSRQLMNFAIFSLNRLMNFWIFSTAIWQNLHFFLVTDRQMLQIFSHSRLTNCSTLFPLADCRNSQLVSYNRCMYFKIFRKSLKKGRESKDCIKKEAVKATGQLRLAKLG